MKYTGIFVSLETSSSKQQHSNPDFGGAAVYI